ncbi:MAG: tetraacyldisaccharide 4'-kinase [Bacteroidetes bacterium]|nr:tetraacyldisaccharide 4'-kinase [Bacteroidota bacterium]
MLLGLLAPFSWLYGAVTGIRNFFYQIGLIKTHSFPCAVISVGNLSVGGTGKTPMIEYLVRLLKAEFTVAVLSRGYGRKTNGFRLADENDNASTIGDEPFQYFKKYQREIEVAVCEDRVLGIRKLLEINSAINVVLLDDAFQHRAVKPLFSILLTDFSKPFFKDYVLPRGRLRESRSGAARADVVVATKCKQVTEAEEDQFNKSIQQYSPKLVYFSTINYQNPISFEKSVMEKNIVLVTGIANSRPMEEHLAVNYSIRHHFRFSDHHDYSLIDVNRIQYKARELGASILTTEKDKVKIESLPIEKKYWFYLPIETEFIKNGSEFDTTIRMKINQHLS